MRYKRFLIAALTLIVAFCGLGIDPAFADYDMPYYIDVDLTNQLVTIYRTSDGVIARQMLCSSGLNDSTPTGTFYMSKALREGEREEWYFMGMYGSWVKYASRIKDGYFFHSITFTSKHDEAISTKALSQYGYPASHGCIRLRIDDAKFIAQNCGVGTRVRIRESGTVLNELREKLFESSYTAENGQTYQEFWGAVDGALAFTSEGEDVRELQLRLRDLGFFSGDVDGQFNFSTVSAVKKLQAELGLPQSGIAALDLQEIIFSNSAPVMLGQTTLREGSNGPVVKKFQSVLQRLGIYDGDIDSVYDVDVVEAVQTLQKVCGYQPDGIATPEIQHLAYYEINRIEQELGSEYELERLSEDIVLATVIYEKSKVLVRAKPSTKSDEVTKLSYGDQVVVLATQGDWAMVIANGHPGFMMQSFLRPYGAENYVYKYTANGQTVTIGSTIEDMASGAAINEQAAFRNYLATNQSMDYLDAATDYVTVSTGSRNTRLNMRSEASSDGEILAEISDGTNLRMLSRDSEWTCVAYNGQIGYLMNQYLSFGDDPSFGAEPSVPEESYEEAPDASYAEDYGESYDETAENTAIVLAGEADGQVAIYEAASVDSQVIGHLDNNAEVQILSIDEDSGWVQVSTGSAEGYMEDQYLSFRLGI